MQQKKLLGILTAFLTAACCVSSAAMAADEDIAGGISAETPAVSIYDEYLDWSQLDSRWGETLMGGTTISRSGCLVTALAIMAVHSDSIDSAAMDNLGITDIEQFNPGVLADGYTSVDGFSTGGAISSWGTINTLVPNITFGADKYLESTEKKDAAEELNALMDEGWHIIARVNNGGFHWVYIEGVGSDGSVYMCDPAMDTHDLYEGYPNGLQGEYWMLKGKNPPASDSIFGAEYEAALNIDITSLPDKTEYQYGEELDLTGGTVMLSGVDPKSGSWTSEPISMTSAENITVDASAYDPTAIGVYDITVSADMGYASAEITFPVTVCLPGGEYYVKDDIPAAVYSEQGNGTLQFTLKKGNVIQINKCINGYGFVELTDITGWVDMSQLEKTEEHIHKIGDINNDDVVDKYDLSLLNGYLQQKEQLPDGISTLTSAQLEAADLNGDGAVDLADVREYLLII